MSIQKALYEEVLAECSNSLDAIALLRQHRPYLETIPSMRRPEESVISIPLPLVKLRDSVPGSHGISSTRTNTVSLPCDLAILMCDPEWKIKTGVEILIFIHRPDEDFSDLLSRWRQAQIYLSGGYEWNMPLRYRHILSEGTDSVYPLFVVFEGTSERVIRGLKGAFLPFVFRRSPDQDLDESQDLSSIELLWSDSEDTLQ